jgi:hypothetical protein
MKYEKPQILAMPALLAIQDIVKDVVTFNEGGTHPWFTIEAYQADE